MLRMFTIIMISILAGIELDIFIPSFPELSRVFNLSPAMVQLTLSVNFISYCVCSLFAAALGDRYNRRHVILIGLFIFVVGSLMCVYANYFSILIIGRFLQGIGMAGPTVLVFAIVADEYPIEKQAAMLGILNGLCAVSMAFAPTVGSYINLYFNWQGNFFILLGGGVLCFILSLWALPNHKGDPTASLSIKAYWPLLKSPKLMTFASCLCFLIVPFWIFIGMSPLLYMEDLGVPLIYFGYYQGATAAVFSIFSLLSPKIFALFGQRLCLYVGIGLCLLATGLILLIVIMRVDNPNIITGVMLILSAGVLFPINILFPLAAGVVENAKGKTTALILAGRLIVSAVCLELVSLIYDHTFFSIGLVMVFFLFLSLIIMRQLFVKKWIDIHY